MLEKLTMQLSIFCTALLIAGSAMAYTNATLNVVACGGVMSNGGYTSIGSIISIGGQTSYAGSLCNYSGFPAGFVLQPETALNGLPDELNPDNDLDGLTDADEIGIYRTSSVLADSDADGMGDAQELIAGTSATNRSSVLSIICTLLPEGNKQLSWFGIQGRTYTFQYCDSLETDNWQSHPSEVTGTGETISFTDSTNLSNRFYRVKVRAAE